MTPSPLRKHPKEFSKVLSLNARRIVNKVDGLELILLTHDPHVIVITETWLHSGIGESEIIPPSYWIIRKDRGSGGGGVAVIFKDSVQLTPLNCVICGEALWCSLKFHGNVFTLGAVYRPPNASPKLLEDLYDSMPKHFTNKTKVILTGYFNLPNID